MTKKYLSVFLLLLLLVSWGLLFYRNTFNAPFERDEGEYAYSAQLLLSGGMPYQNSFLQKPPMIIYTYAAGLFLDPRAVWPPRLLAFIFTVLTAILVGLVAKKEYGWEAGLIAAFIFIPMNAFPYLTSYAANTERFMQLPLIGALVLYVYFRKKSSWKVWFLAGFLASLAFFYKQLCALAIAFIFLYWLAEAGGLLSPLKERAAIIAKKMFGALDEKSAVLRERFSAQNFIVLKNLWPAFLGAATGFLLTFGYFLAHGTFGYIWETAFVFNRYYLADNNFLSSIRYFSAFWQRWPLFCLILIWYPLARLPRAGFYLALFIFSAISAATSPAPHYFLLAIPFWAIIIGASLGDIVSHLNSWPAKNILGKILVFLSVAALALGSAVVPVASQFEKTPDQMNLWVYGPTDPFDEARLVGEKIKKATGKDDRIFIAGSEPEIFYYSQRQCATRFDITYPFIINSPFQTDYQKEAVAQLEKNPPAAIVFSPLESSGFSQAGTPGIISDYLAQLVKNNYTLVGAFIRRPDLTGYWKNGTPDADEMPEATLSLYLKNKN